ncbi:MAG TPA: glycosyltransferase [Candidatus Binatia bacterium]
MQIFFIFAVLSTLSWAGFAVLFRRSWSVQEVLDAGKHVGDDDLGDITALIPARNEAEVIERTLRSVVRQGPGMKVVLIDDGSQDGTVEQAQRLASPVFHVIRSTPLPAGWNGKLWALEQGRHHVATCLTLLLDADIELDPGIVKALRQAMHQKSTALISLTAEPEMSSIWEKLLMPAFVFFFKTLYPFHRVNSADTKYAAAAGGCILLETQVLDRIGGFAAMKSAIIDDCTLARHVKSHGYKIWLGLTHSVRTTRTYRGLRDIGEMIARCAFTQLHYSIVLLVLCTFALFLLYALPGLLLASSSPALRYLSLFSLSIMMVAYLPTLRFYGRSPVWALCLPLVALFYLAMTWTSALRYWRGECTRWKGRIYRREATGISGEVRLR